MNDESSLQTKSLDTIAQYEERGYSLACDRSVRRNHILNTSLSTLADAAIGYAAYKTQNPFVGIAFFALGMHVVNSSFELYDVCKRYTKHVNEFVSSDLALGEQRINESNHNL